MGRLKEASRLWIELALLYGTIPVLASVTSLCRYPLAVLFVSTAIGVGIAGSGGFFREGAWREGSWNVPASSRSGIGRCMIEGGAIWLAGLGAACIAGTIRGSELFPYFRESPRPLAAIFLIYAASVMAQEFSFRAFFFWRYRALFRGNSLVWANSALFSWAHLVYGSWVTLALCLPGGALFSLLYARHRSLWGVILIHLLVGMTVFAMGYGSYFYRG